MPRKPPKPVDPWKNRFQTPGGDVLFDAIEGPGRDLYEAARTRLDQIADAGCEIRWLGVPWRWSLVYTLASDSGEVLAYLVPDPVKPQLCVPLDYDSLERVTPKRLSRAVRDAIVFAAEVGGVRWACWDLQSETQIDEILLLVKAKVESRTATA